MNERSRRQQHQSRHRSGLAGSASSQSNHNRSLYQGHPSDNYSTSNYRHPSTTTTTTSTTTTTLDTLQSDDECFSSICYSYLIAIVSSFLVVLGIYLSLTKFNIRYLYISLVGLLIEAISACIYCVSNIHSSKLARRKQRVNLQESHGARTDRDGGNNLSNLTRQQEIATITDILNNRTLTTTNDVANANDSSAITNDNGLESAQNDRQINPLVTQNDPQTSSSEIQQLNSVNNELPDQVNISIPAMEESQQDDQIDSVLSSTSTQNTSSKLLPKRSNSSDSPDNPSSLASSDNNQNHSASNQCSSNMVSLIHVSTSNSENDTDVALNSVLGDPTQKTKMEPQSSNSTDNPEQASNPPIDLINLDHENSRGYSNPSAALPATEPSVPRRNVSKTNHNRANLRRTLVMGLSGEEEMIEIDEDDLDNMSILPPTYESIAADKPRAD